MLRVALVTVGDPARRTGGYLYHAEICAGLRAQGIEVDEIVAAAAELEAQQAAAAAFAAQFDAAAYDVVLVDALARGVCGPSIAAWRRCCAVIGLVHQLPSVAEAAPERAAAERALEEPLLQADALVAVSEHGRELLVRRGAARRKIVVIPPGYDRRGVQPGATPEIVRPAAGPARVLTVAQWIPRKGITTLVEAWRELRPANAVLELIGETDADPAYAAAVRALVGTTPGIVVRGAVPDAELDAAYRAADIFALPSRFEGYGMVYAEALAYGLPVVASTAGPIPAIVTPEAGICVPPDDPAALAAALGQLLVDPALRAKLATGALRRAAALPRWNDAVTGFRRVFAAVLTQRLQRAAKAQERS